MSFDFWPTATVLTGILSRLVGVWVGHRLDLGRARTLKQEADIKGEQVTFLPLIERTMQKVAKGQPLDIWRKQNHDLKAAAGRFRIFLPPKTQKALDQAWQKLENLRDSDLLNSQNSWFTDVQGPELLKARETLCSKLERLYEAVERA